MTQEDAQLLFSLSAEFDSLRQSVALARLIAECPEKARSRNPALNFAMSRAPTAVFENIVLRMAEAIDPLFERARRHYGKPSLFQGRSRNRHAVDPHFDLAIRLRSEAIAHRIKLNGRSSPSFRQLQESYDSVFTFASDLLDSVEQELDALRVEGLFDAFHLKPVAFREIPEFGANDLIRLIEAANGLEPAPAA